MITNILNNEDYMQHYYYNIQGWFNYQRLYEHVVNECTNTDLYIFVEVGSWKGCSTSFMGVEILNSKKNIKFYAVDTWEGSEEHLDKTNPSFEAMLDIPDALYNTFLKNIEPIKDVVIPIRKSSIEASEEFEDNTIDFIMIDAAHDYENVIKDLHHWYPKLRIGGIMSGDDIDWPGVKQAVDEFFKTDYTNHNNEFWLHQKLK